MFDDEPSLNTAVGSRIPPPVLQLPNLRKPPPNPMIQDQVAACKYLTDMIPINKDHMTDEQGQQSLSFSLVAAEYARAETAHAIAKLKLDDLLETDRDSKQSLVEQICAAEANIIVSKGSDKATRPPEHILKALVDQDPHVIWLRDQLARLKSGDEIRAARLMIIQTKERVNYTEKLCKIFEGRGNLIINIGKRLLHAEGEV